MDLGLKDKVAIVTGASRGLGFATSRTLAGEGAQVVICSRNTHTLAAKEPLADLVISSTLRPGIHALNKTLTSKYASYNISFNAVAPGFILTKQQEEIFESRAAGELSVDGGMTRGLF